MLTSRITSKAQTTIPQPVRRVLRIAPGDVVEYLIEGDQVIIRKARVVAAQDDPFVLFSEWDGDADREAYADL